MNKKLDDNNINLIDISKHIESNPKSEAFNPKTIIIGASIITFVITISITIALLIKFLN